MAKKVKTTIKLYCPAGQANPSPPVGPALGQHGVNIMDFCRKFNEKTKGKEGLLLPVVISVYEDRTFSFITKSAPSSVLLKQACGIAKASGETGKVTAGQVTHKQVEEIAKTKMKDLNATELSAGIKIIEGTARSMGIEVVDKIEKVEKPAEEATSDKVEAKVKDKDKKEDQKAEEKK